MGTFDHSSSANLQNLRLRSLSRLLLFNVAREIEVAEEFDEDENVDQDDDHEEFGIIALAEDELHGVHEHHAELDELQLR